MGTPTGRGSTEVFRALDWGAGVKRGNSICNPPGQSRQTERREGRRALSPSHSIPFKEEARRSQMAFGSLFPSSPLPRSVSAATG